MRALPQSPRTAHRALRRIRSTSCLRTCQSAHRDIPRLVFGQILVLIAAEGRGRHERYSATAHSTPYEIATFIPSYLLNKEMSVLLLSCVAQKNFSNLLAYAAENQSIRKRSFNLTDAALHDKYKKSGGGLNDNDRKVLIRFYERVDSVCEWGVGESTNIASYVGLKRYTGIDSSIDWLNIVKEHAPKHYRFGAKRSFPFLGLSRP